MSASDTQPSSDTQPIIGGDTAVTLTAAATLTSLGVSVAPLGTAALHTSGGTPVADFRITGGTEGPGSGNDVILHQGGGLALSDKAGRIDLADFRIDTQNRVVDANVTVDGKSAGNVAVFDIGSDGRTLTLTAAAAKAADAALGTTALTAGTTIGTAAPDPVASPISFQSILLPFATFLDAEPMHAAGTSPMIGGDTSVTLTSAGTLQSLGVSVKPLGSASIDTSGKTPVADFAITGGTAGPDAGENVILHQGSGLELSDKAGRIDLRDFLIDTRNHVVDANVTTNGKSLGNVAVFDIGSDGKTLTFTAAAAEVADKVLDTTALSSTTVVGTAAPHPVVLPGGVATLLATIAEAADGHLPWTFTHA